MLSPLVEAQIAEVSTEISELETQLARLRRRRNSFLPISALPPELITTILKLILGDAILSLENAVDSSAQSTAMLHALRWINLTHVYAYWRDVALGCPTLWTFICTTNPEKFHTFLKRSQNQLVYVDIWPPKAVNMRTQMFRFLVPHMHRVRSLRICPECVSWDFVRSYGISVNAPHLEVLRFTGSGGRGWQGNSVILPVAMPNLRLLEVSGRPRNGWRCLLPSHLPTVKELVLTNLNYLDELDVLNRCPAINKLSVKHSREFASNYAIPDIALPNLPNLSHLHVNDVGWPLFLLLSLPSIQHVAIRMTVHNRDILRCFDDLANLINSEQFNNSTRKLDQPRHLSVSCCGGRVVKVQAHNAANDAFVTFSAPLATHAPAATEQTPEIIFECLPQLARSSKLGINLINVEDSERWQASYLQCLFCTLFDSSDIKTIRIHGIVGLACLLTVTNYKCHHKPRGERQNICTCRKCCEMRGTSYPGLETLVLDGIDKEQIRKFGEGKGWTALAGWLRERSTRGSALNTLVLGHRSWRLEAQIPERISRAVGNVVVD